jgi:hypothetical protein
MHAENFAAVLSFSVPSISPISTSPSVSLSLFLAAGLPRFRRPFLDRLEKPIPLQEISLAKSDRSVRPTKSSLIAFRVHFDYSAAEQSSVAGRINGQEDGSFAL